MSESGHFQTKSDGYPCKSIGLILLQELTFWGSASRRRVRLVHPFAPMDRRITPPKEDTIARALAQTIQSVAATSRSFDAGTFHARRSIDLVPEPLGERFGLAIL
jgi:hypothetical protein